MAHFFATGRKLSLPSGEKAIEFTSLAWPSKERTSVLAATFQSFRMPPRPPNSANLPSGDKATDFTSPVSIGKRFTSRPVAISQRFRRPARNTRSVA